MRFANAWSAASQVKDKSKQNGMLSKIVDVLIKEHKVGDGKVTDMNIFRLKKRVKDMEDESQRKTLESKLANVKGVHEANVDY